VQSRLKWLARLGEIAEAHTESDFDWEFAPPRKLPRPLVTLEKAAAGYGAHQVLRSVSLSVAPGDRLGVLGRNGAGKSTLMRLLAGELQPQAGTRTPSPELAVGFFAQLEVEQLDGGGSPLSELARRGGAEVAAWTPQQQRDHLGRFGFGGQRVFEPTINFSGGERSRLALAILVARRPNLLLLDEPTNHLDLSMRHTLLLALQEFPGAVIVVSHDRALLRGACDRFVLVANGALTPFEGDLEDYAAWLRASSAPAADTAAAKGSSRREQRRQEAEARARRSPLTSERQELETRLAALARAQADVESRLADPATYAELTGVQQRQLAQRREDLGAQIAALEQRWLAVMAALEERAG
jgi:ATP-binding cassette subfamily F protein 3